MSTPTSVPIKLDPVSLVLHASGPVFIVVWALLLAALLVWVIAVLKVLQLSRLGTAQRAFERDSARVFNANDLVMVAQQHPEAPGARVARALFERGGPLKMLESTVKRAIVTEQQRASSLMVTLSSIAAAGPFVGLFGTVYGIMDAFLRIGQEKSASLPVVAPAIGEALIATAIGLFAAIPAVVAYNGLTKRIDDLLSELEASSEAWIAVMGDVAPARSLPSTPPLRGV